MRRLFFALWPHSALQLALADATQKVVLACGGRAVPPENLHITLAFLGSVPEADVGQVESIAEMAAREIERAPMQVTLDRIEYWKKAKVLCATVAAQTGADPPGAYATAPGAYATAPGAYATAPGAPLAAALKSHLTAAGFAPDLKPFRPHVTLARKVPHGTRDRTLQSVLWSFADFALIESRTAPEGSSYSVLNSWSLCTEVHKKPKKKHK